MRILGENDRPVTVSNLAVRGTLQSVMAPGAHRLFFAVIPGAEALQSISRVALGVREARTIRGSWVEPDRYHLTLQFLGDFVSPQATIAIAMSAAQRLRFAPIDFLLDRVATFGGRFRAPCVLRCSRESDTLAQTLWRLQGEALKEAGFDGDTQRRFKPHVTIGYGDQVLAEPLAIAPIAWRAEEFVLVDSAVGRGRHDVIARWPLTGS